MKRTTHLFLLMAAVITALLASAVGPYAVYADDGVTTEPSGEEAPTSDSTGDEVPASEPTGDEPVVEEPVSIPEVLEQAPEGTEVVVVNETGEVLPLVTEEAAAIISTSDPMWCPEGVTPGDTGCTSSFGTFDELIDALAADALLVTPQFTGNGVIWVEDTYNDNDNAQIELNGSVLTNVGSSNLTIQGGWSGGNNTNVTGTSNLDVSLVIVNWGGNVSLNDLAIAAEDGSGFGLLVNNSGSVFLDNVSVSDTALNSYGYGDGALIATSGNVTATNSQFNNNAGNGLQILSGGDVELDTVSASGNDLTGASIDTCIYNSATGLCAGNGSVIVTSTTGNQFNDNGFIGLNIDAGGGAALEHVQANDNALDGAVITSADNNGTGDVVIDESDFSGNANAYGLDVYTDGNIDVSNVTANSNNLGAFLDTTPGTGSVFVSDSTFGDSNLTGNTWTGLHIESGANVTLTNLIASYNGTNGAYVVAEDDIYVENGAFNENVHFNFPQDPGLYANSNGGSITLLDVVANGNDFGAGAVLSTNGAGNIHVSSTVPGNSQFNENGLFGVQATTGNGDITLLDIQASYNDSKGTYVNSHGMGNVFIENSLFVENGNYGIYASANQGDITLNNVIVTGDDLVATTPADDLTDVGALLIAHGGGTVFVTDSIFELNTNAGLVIIGNNTAELVNVTADGNGINGVEAYTTQTASCRKENDPVVNLIVNVEGGTVMDNGEYGFFIQAGPSGELNFFAPATVFGGNGVGNFLVDLSEAEICPPEPEEPEDTDKPNVIYVPAAGNPPNEPVEQDCELFTSTIHELPNGSFVNVGCPYEGFSNMNGILVTELPGALGAGTSFVDGMVVSLTDADGNTILNQNGTVTINFAIPENSRGRNHSVLFWDQALNDGAGGWIKLPPFEAGTSFPLHPENPDDPRLVVSGVQQVDNFITFTVNFSGTFVLTTP